MYKLMSCWQRPQRLFLRDQRSFIAFLSTIYAGVKNNGILIDEGMSYIEAYRKNGMDKKVYSVSQQRALLKEKERVTKYST